MMDVIPTRKFFDPACFLPYEDRLQPLFGSDPHRISHITAMAMTGEAIKSGFALHVSGPPVDAEDADALRVRPHEESEDTLFLFADTWDGATLKSRPERALLESLAPECRLPGAALMAARVLCGQVPVSSDNVTRVSEALGLNGSLRRLGSVAAAMDDCRDVFRPAPDGFLPDWRRDFLDLAPASSDAEWVCLRAYPHDEPDTPPAFLDEKYRVTWCLDHPHQILEDLLY